MGLTLTFCVVGLCMAIMAIGLILKGKPVCKDCGLDPMTGERIGHCHCADEGSDSSSAQTDTDFPDGKVVSFPERTIEKNPRSAN